MDKAAFNAGKTTGGQAPGVLALATQGSSGQGAGGQAPVGPSGDAAMNTEKGAGQRAAMAKFFPDGIQTKRKKNYAKEEAAYRAGLASVPAVGLKAGGKVKRGYGLARCR